MTSNPGRKTNTALAPVTNPADPTQIALAAQAADMLSATQHRVLEAADIYRLVGRMEAAQFMETVSARVMAETYLKAKSHIGKTGSITVKRKDGTAGTVSGMEEFCEAVMPVTARRCRQIIAAIDTLGVELYEQAEQIGFRARDYQALRALPDDQQAVVKRAIEAGDLGAAVDIVHELAARNSAMQHKLAEAEKVAVAKNKVIAKKDEKINTMQEAEERRLSANPNEREQALLNDVRDAALAAEMAIRKLVRVAAVGVDAPPTEAAGTASLQAAQFVAVLFGSLLSEAGIPVDLDEAITPHWLKDVPKAGDKPAAA